MKQLKTPLTIRGDSLYCPLSFSLDTYGNCEADCWHCYLRRLNATWGQDLKPVNLEILQKQLVNGLHNPRPKSPLAWALHHKKTLRFGNKTDPFQPAEQEHRVSKQALLLLHHLHWSVVIQTMFTEIMMDYQDTITEMKDIVIMQPIISCGYDRDWEILERKRTTHPDDRLRHILKLRSQGVSIAVNGEPFIPGYHSPQEFEEMIKRLKDNHINRYNIYNFHFNAFVARRLHAIGIDIEKIWYHNQDAQWKSILQQLIDIAKKYDMILGCPDFVNVGIGYNQRCNTCCGVDVPTPTTFNTHTWIRMIQEGKDAETILRETWDGIGDFEQGQAVLTKKSSKFYTISDAKNSGLGIL